MKVFWGVLGIVLLVCVIAVCVFVLGKNLFFVPDRGGMVHSVPSAPDLDEIVQLEWRQTASYARGCFGFLFYPEKDGFSLEAHWIDPMTGDPHNAERKCDEADRQALLAVLKAANPHLERPKTDDSKTEIFALDATETAFSVTESGGTVWVCPGADDNGNEKALFAFLKELALKGE